MTVSEFKADVSEMKENMSEIKANVSKKWTNGDENSLECLKGEKTEN